MQLSTEAYLERYGHDWRQPERAREYAERVDRELPQRAEGLAIMLALVPGTPGRILDIGTGPGLLAAMLLDRFPSATAIGLDVSEPMREIATARMADYGDRFRFVLGDFVEGELPADGPFDLAVSSRAIHHIPRQLKQRLYAAVFKVLAPGGAFFNLDSVAPGEGLADVFREANARLVGRPTREGQHHPPGHYYDPVPDHLAFLRQAGFSHVDCFWKRLGTALVGGFKAA
jgi:tRNA (cmo5U34)-methyltransferase